MAYKKPNVKDILRKHSARIEGKIKTTGVKDVSYSREYVKFKQEMSPELTRYERWCRSLGNVIKLKIAKKDEDKIKRQLEVANLDLESWQVLTLSVMVFLGVLLFVLVTSIAITLIRGSTIFRILFLNISFIVS